MEKAKTFDNVPEGDVILNYVNHRFRVGLGTNIFIIGLSGTGKSSSSIRQGELIIESRPKEELKMFVVDSLLELLAAIKQSKEGDIIIIEEVSVLFPSRRAMGSENLAIAKIFDTIRKKRLCLISNAPLWNSIDNHMKSMAHVLMQTIKIYKTEGVVVSKFWRIQTDPSSGKIYRHTMTRKGKEVDRMILRRPNKDRWEQYEKDKEDFMDQLYLKLKREQEKKEMKASKEVVTISNGGLTPREAEVNYLSTVAGLTPTQIAKKLGITYDRVAQLRKAVRNKTKVEGNTENNTQYITNISQFKAKSVAV
jgi:DNA-binding CsgD family transcriptional regulator